FYLKGFDDLIDWQRDVNRFDLHSIGGTQVDPGRARPQFMSIGTDDYRIVAQLAGQRFSSPTSDAGDILSDNAVSRSTTNLLVNPSFETTLSGWNTNIGASIAGSGGAWAGSTYFSAGAVTTGFAEQ